MGTPSSPHLASIRWRENVGDGKWQPAPDLKVVDESDQVGGDMSTAAPTTSDGEAWATIKDGHEDDASALTEGSMPPARTLLPVTQGLAATAAASDGFPPADLTLRFGDGPWTVKGLLVDLELAKSLGDAGRMIRAGLVAIQGHRVAEEEEGLDNHLRRGEVKVVHPPEDEDYDSEGEDAPGLSVYLSISVTRLGRKTVRVREKRDGEDDASLYVWESLSWKGDRGKNFLRRS